jgi:hypothetical protein
MAFPPHSRSRDCPQGFSSGVPGFVRNSQHAMMSAEPAWLKECVGGSGFDTRGLPSGCAMGTIDLVDCTLDLAQVGWASHLLLVPSGTTPFPEVLTACNPRLLAGKLSHS